ncbi:MAG: PEGA domain-containing protein [Blastocatellia bacterium]|nr:PEGA domain-containing protein [Blastocatellia bacterium]
MSSADAATGETVDFEVLEDVLIGDVIVIARESVALATVTHAKAKARMGKGGKLDMTIDSVRLTSGEKVALRAVKESKGGSSTGAMTGAIVATSILFFPAAPFFLFMKGKDIKIPKGTEITAYVNGDVTLDRSKFVPRSMNGLTVIDQLPAASAHATSTVLIRSEPDGAEIMIDDRFVGNTPSTLQLSPGDHRITVRRAGYIDWERTVTSSAGGNVTLNAVLERP